MRQVIDGGGGKGDVWGEKRLSSTNKLVNMRIIRRRKLNCKKKYEADGWMDGEEMRSLENKAAKYWIGLMGEKFWSGFNKFFTELNQGFRGSKKGSNVKHRKSRSDSTLDEAM